METDRIWPPAIAGGLKPSNSAAFAAFMVWFAGDPVWGPVARAHQAWSFELSRTVRGGGMRDSARLARMRAAEEAARTAFDDAFVEAFGADPVALYERDSGPTRISGRYPDLARARHTPLYQVRSARLAGPWVCADGVRADR
jgi:hypothetical protein